MKLRAFILFILFASANFVPTTTFAVSATTSICSSNHGNDVPPVHAHADCPHVSHGLNLTYVPNDYYFEVSDEIDVVKHAVFYIIHTSLSYLDKLFKPPRQ